MWHRGSLTLFCNSCRYVIRRWHVPILGVDCNSNPRHKQALSNPPPRSRGVPKHLSPYIFSKQYPKHPYWRTDAIFLSNSSLKYRIQSRRH
ncbi:U3 small nucleolar RNA-associated protein 5 [Babesia microti strain RI]|uniref:U3 small nucleolar RNA-associated protein 5 n=1 Tax=Babesia microti (strain RI) TaxID=1133968 RepID=A0A1R4A9Y8_BABMR|nr:U3 small nucleolar RNA-associated protein 5 [Babesia microti strain RI]SJK85800.1 U3 small nucleolar RNA-associated protein 5 [Babesia microti strain RI]|eukprot:XP_012647863.2 U3 small nucleolar RNA-associated protein 5 [Babesia microti strain RI]